MLAQWILATRPKTLVVSIAPVLMAAVLARSSAIVDPWILLNLFLTALGIQIGTNLANDYYDFIQGSDTERRIGPKRVCASGAIAPKHMRIAMIIAFLSSALSSIALIQIKGPLVALCMLIAVILGIGYTAKPIALAHRGLGDIVAFMTFGPVATSMSFLLLTGSFSSTAVVAGIAPGAFSAAILGVNNLRDRMEDKNSGKRTIPVRFGENVARTLYAALIILAFSTPMLLVVFCGAKSSILYTTLLSIIGVTKIRALFEVIKPHGYIPFLEETVRMLLTYTVVFSLLWLWT